MIYEINFLVLQSKTAELEKIRKSTKKFIESFGAKVVEEKEYLKRKLAYEIQHENYGFFTVLRFEFKGKTNLDELKSKLNQRTEVARYIIVQADNLPSLKEQDVKAQEKIQTDRKSIKSEDVEKALKEQKKTESKVEEEKKEKAAPVVEKKEKKVEKPAEKKTEEKEAPKTEKEDKPKKEKAPKAEKEKKPKKPQEKPEEKAKEEKPAEKKEEKIEEPKEKKEKTDEPKEKKEKVSLDELDKKLDEILNS